MSKKYKAKYYRLMEWYQELYDHLIDTDDDNRRLTEDLRYYSAFVEWKKLNDEFAYFRENAYDIHEEDSPFPMLIL